MLPIDSDNRDTQLPLIGDPVLPIDRPDYTSELRKVVSRLSPLALLQLEKLVSREETRTRTERMLLGVHATSPGREEELLQILSKYRGRWFILESFLQGMETNYDYFRAVAQSKVKVAFVSDIDPTAQRWATDQSAGVSADRDSVKGAAGLWMNGNFFVIHSARDQIIMPPVGFDALISLYEFVKPAQVEASSKAIHKKKIGQRIKQLLLFTDEDEHSFDELITKGKSKLVAKEIDHLIELKKLISEARAELDEKAFGNQIVMRGVIDALVRDKTGGAMLGWIERRINQPTSERDVALPEWVRVDFETVVNPLVDSDRREHDNAIRRLRVFYFSEQRISKESAFQAVEGDLQLALNLPSDHPVFKQVSKTALRNILAANREITSTNNKSISLLEMGKVLASFPLDQIRLHFNSIIIEKFDADYRKAILRFSGFYRTADDGRWRDDSKGDVVKPRRLEDHLYLAKLGRPQARTIDFDELRQIKVAVALDTLRQTEVNFLCAMNCADFERMVRTMVLAVRKAEYIDRALVRAYPESLPQGFTKENISGTLGRWNFTPPARSDLFPSEELEGKIEEVARMSIEEIVRRRELIARGTEVAWKHYQHIKDLLDVKLASEETIQLIQSWYREYGGLVPSENVPEIFRAKAVLASPLMVIDSSNMQAADLDSPLLDEWLVQRARAIAGLHELLGKYDLSNSPANIELVRELKVQEKRRYFWLSKNSEEGWQITVGRVEFVSQSEVEGELALGQDPTDLNQKIHYRFLNGIRLREALNVAREEYVAIDLSPGTLARLKTLLDPASKALLPVDSPFRSWSVVRALRMFCNVAPARVAMRKWWVADYLPKMLVDELNALTSDWVGPSPHFRIQEKGLVINFGRYKGSSIEKIPTSYFAFLARQAESSHSGARSGLPPHVLEIVRLATDSRKNKQELNVSELMKRFSN